MSCSCAQLAILYGFCNVPSPVPIYAIAGMIFAVVKARITTNEITGNPQLYTLFLKPIFI